MSLFRPQFLEDLIKPIGGTTLRLRGLKGFNPPDVVAFNDPFYAEDPVFWELQGDLAAAAGFTGHLGVELPDVAGLVVSVDDLYIGVTVADLVDIWVSQGEGFVRTPLVTDQQVAIRNRREQGPNAGFAARAGLFRIVDNTTAVVGQSRIAQARMLANTTTHLYLGHRLHRTEQCWCENSAANIGLTLTMQGRMQSKRSV